MWLLGCRELLCLVFFLPLLLLNRTSYDNPILTFSEHFLAWQGESRAVSCYAASLFLLLWLQSLTFSVFLRSLRKIQSSVFLQIVQGWRWSHTSALEWHWRFCFVHFQLSSDWTLSILSFPHCGYLLNCLVHLDEVSVVCKVSGLDAEKSLCFRPDFVAHIAHSSLVHFFAFLRSVRCW